MAEQEAKAVQGQKQAETEQRIRVAGLEAKAVKGENEAKARSPPTRPRSERQAEAQASRGVWPLASAARGRAPGRAPAGAWRGWTRSRSSSRKIEQTARSRSTPRPRRNGGAGSRAATADAILARYRRRPRASRRCWRPRPRATDQLKRLRRPAAVGAHAAADRAAPERGGRAGKAIQNLKIDKITVWDSGGRLGRRGGSRPPAFLKSLIGSLPRSTNSRSRPGSSSPATSARSPRWTRRRRPSAGSRPRSERLGPRAAGRIRCPCRRPSNRRIRPVRAAIRRDVGVELSGRSTGAREPGTPSSPSARSSCSPPRRGRRSPSATGRGSGSRRRS